MAADPYQELGVARTASADEVRKAFRKLAKKLHPDQNPGDKPAEERFKRVSAAFDILGDPEKRKKFDAGQIDADGHEVHRGFRDGLAGAQHQREAGRTSGNGEPVGALHLSRGKNFHAKSLVRAPYPEAVSMVSEVPVLADCIPIGLFAYSVSFAMVSLSPQPQANAR